MTNAHQIRPQSWMVVKLDVDIFYWRDVEGWVTSDAMCSKYPNKGEAESKMLLLAAKDPTLIGKLHIKNYYDNGFATEQDQGVLF